MSNTLPRPWCTRGEAAEYLRVSADTVDRLLVPEAEGRQQGRLRFRKIDWSRPRQFVRVASEDVLALLPEPEAGGSGGVGV